MFKRLVLLMVMIFSVQFTAAETEKTVEDYVNYIELKSFTTNLDGVGKPRFLKCEVTIQVSSESAHHAVNAHMPQIRNDLVFLLSSQSDETVGTVDAQNRLAKKALEAVKKVLMEEEGESFVSDLFFTSFVVQ